MPLTSRPTSPAIRTAGGLARLARAAVGLALSAALLGLPPGGSTGAQAAPNTPLPLPVLVFAGQSNMVGFITTVDELTPEQKQTQTNVLFYGPNENGSTWGSLVPPTVHTNAVGTNVGFGPETSTGLSLTHMAGFGLVAEVKHASVGTNLDYDWDPDVNNREYGYLLDRVQTALTALALAYPERTPYVAGFFWMQGEADAYNVGDMALAYQTNLLHLIEEVREDYGDPNLPIVLGQILCCHHEAGLIRAAQAHAAATVPNVRLVLTDDLGHETEQGLHFTSAGTWDLGERFGTVFATMAILTQKVYVPVAIR